MMSLYHMLYGVKEGAGLVLTVLGLERANVPRFRDAGYDNERDRLWVYARTGGPNREYYDNAILTTHELYDSDEDDDYDNTYATFWFRRPDAFYWPLASEKPIDWESAIEKFKKELGQF